MTLYIKQEILFNFDSFSLQAPELKINSFIKKRVLACGIERINKQIESYRVDLNFLCAFHLSFWLRQ